MGNFIKLRFLLVLLAVGLALCEARGVRPAEKNSGESKGNQGGDGDDDRKLGVLQ